MSANSGLNVINPQQRQRPWRRPVMRKYPGKATQTRIRFAVECRLLRACGDAESPLHPGADEYLTAL
jgi:hypothetical protein